MQMEQFIKKLSDEGVAKPLPHPLVIAAIGLGIVFAYFMLMLVMIGLRPDIAIKLQQGWFVSELLIILYAVVAAIVAASYLALPDNGQKPWVRFMPTLPLAIMAIALGFLMTRPGAMTLAECIKAGHFACILHLIMFSIAPTALLFIAMVRAAPTFDGWAGAMAGLAGGCLGYALLRLMEASDDAIIMATWHMLPVVLVTVVSMLLGKRLLSQWA